MSNTKRTIYLLGMLVVAIVAYVLVRSAQAADLPSVPPPSDNSFLIFIVVIALIIGAGIYLHRRFPSQSDKAAAETAAGIHALLQKLDQKTALAPAPADAPAAPAAPAGKNGVAGALTVQVTGDPKVDMPAINAAYFS